MICLYPPDYTFLGFFFFFFFIIIMNLIIWNCRGSLNPNFCNNVSDLVHIHSPAISILTETKTCGERAKRIISKLPFDGAIFTNTISLIGGLWLLWDSSQVEVTKLATTKQEIHAVVTPTCSNSTWLLSTIYASPRFAKRCLI